MTKYYSEESVEKLLKSHGIIEKSLSSIKSSNPLEELPTQELVDEISRREKKTHLGEFDPNILKVKSTKELLKELSYRNCKFLRENHIENLQNKLIRKILPITAKGDPEGNIILKFSGRENITIVNVSYLDKNGRLRVKIGSSKKRKGDVYNRELGQLMALIDAI